MIRSNAARSGHGNDLVVRNGCGRSYPTLYGIFTVALHMFRQMVGPHEAPSADIASKLLLPGVRPLMAGELVGAGECASTALPLARKRLFSCKEKNLKNLEHFLSLRLP